MFTHSVRSLIILFLTLILTPCNNISRHSAPACSLQVMSNDAPPQPLKI